MVPSSSNRSSRLTSDQRGIDRAWERHVGGAAPGSRPATGVRPEIQRSWQRSTEAGIDPGSGAAPLSEDPAELEWMRQVNRDLMRAAKGSLDKIGRMLHGAETILILTDARGYIIEALGDPKTLRAARDINLYMGGIWNENAIGTNGIGTALEAGEPMFVHGTEHFVESLKEWSCAGAPIRNPVDQSIIGAVDLSGLTRIFRRHNTALAAAVAGEIEAALGQALNEERIRLLDALIEQVPAAGREDGLLILDRSGRILHRSGFERLILSDGREIDARMGRRLVSIEGPPSSDRIAAALPPALACRWVNPLKIDGEWRGVAVLLDKQGQEPRRRQRVRAGQSRPDPQPVPGTGIVAECDAMLEAIDLARRVARMKTPVLVQGETGTGKELFARLIHSDYAGQRKVPFIAINCGGIPRELFGGELFGYVHGAFTGAAREGKPGKLELANGGVFCLDEIGEMPLEIQPYLLRVLEEQVVYRIGDSRARPFDARLVALTNRDLRAEAEAGRFRSDLFYRISAVTVQVPPLRERGQDIIRLLDWFNRMVVRELGLEPLRFSPEVQAVFLRYPWPGNVRELRNLVQRLHTISRSREIGLTDLPPEFVLEPPRRDTAPAPAPGAGDPKPETGGMRSLKQAERQAILKAIEMHQGNLSRVAETLGISRPTLYRKLRLYGIERRYR